jgi:hypothetical protein
MAKKNQPDLVIIADLTDDSTHHGVQFVIVRPKNMTANRVMKIASAAYDKAKKQHPTNGTGATFGRSSRPRV